MRRVTGNFQITLPKRLVNVYDIQVGDEVESVATGESIAIVPARSRPPELSSGERRRRFAQSTGLQAKRDRDQSRTASGERRAGRGARGTPSAWPPSLTPMSWCTGPILVRLASGPKRCSFRVAVSRGAHCCCPTSHSGNLCQQ